MSRSWVAAASCAVLGCVFASDARAGQIVLDFNDLTPGQLSGQGGSTGMSGTWVGSTNPSVVPGDLTAPLTTHYTLAQSAGTAQSLRSTNNSGSTDGQDVRPVLNAPLGGTIWFSFLANPNASTSRAGISFNASTTSSPSSAGGARIDVNGTSLFNSYGGGNGTPVSNAQSVGTAHLYVGQVIVNEGGGTFDHLRLWIDPDVQTLTEDTTAKRVFDGNTFDWVGNGITTVAVQSYGDGSTPGGTVDAVRVSNNATAQQDVTGFAPASTPEPGSLALSALGAGALLGRRRRQVR